MTGIEVAIPYIAAAVGINSLYGAATGETGGLVGELMGTQDKIDSQTAAAKQQTLDRQSAQDAAMAKAQADNQAALGKLGTSGTMPAAQVSLAAPPKPAAPTLMPSLAASQATAKRETLLQSRMRAGRASTILTGTSDLLGG